MLLLGVKHGTKVGRPQPISTDDAVAIQVVSAFHASTPDGCHLRHLTTYQSYNATLRKARRTAGVEHLSFAPHSARSGWATECRLQGMDFTEIKILNSEVDGAVTRACSPTSTPALPS